jgi:simple sugar transport system permease protein
VRIAILKTREILAKDINLIILVVVTMGALVVLTSILGSRFLSLMNLQSMAYQIPEFGFLALAMMLCMLVGGIDLSIVSIATLSSVLAAKTLTHLASNGGDIFTAIAVACFVAISVSIICGLINGFLIARISILPILATLSTMILYTGIAMAITGGAGITGFPRDFIKLGIITLADIPIIFIIFTIVAVIISFLLGITKLGQSMYFLGENSTVSMFSGIKNEKVTIITYTIAGFLCGVSSLIMMSRVNSARVGYGDTYLLQAILVCALGGVNPNGGKGKVIGVVIAIIVLQILQSGFTLLNFPPYIKSLIWGSVLIIVMILNFVIDRKNFNV